MQTLLKFIPPKEIPVSEDLFSADLLKDHLAALGEPPLSLIAAVGDIMLGGRRHGRPNQGTRPADYPFGAAVLPILQRARLSFSATSKVRMAAEGAKTGSEFFLPRETKAGEFPCCGPESMW